MRGVITFVFDDGYEAVFKHVVPLLNERKLPGVFAIPLETDELVKTTGQRFVPWQQWLPLREGGHEIAAHGITHSDLTTLSSEQLQQELQRPAEALGATTLVYPGGAHDERVAKAVQTQYQAARTVQHGFESLSPQHPWQLKTIDYTQRNWSLLKANLRVAWAWLTNSWLIETYHLVYPTLDGVDSPESTLHHSVPFAEFARHVAFIQKMPIAVKTIHAHISDRHH